MNYLDFDLHLERAGERYKARVLNSPAGQATVEFSLPHSELELENFLLKIGRPRRSTRSTASSELATTKAFGNRLFRAVFEDAIDNCFRRSLDEAKRQKAGLRLRLRLAEVPELANVPWEYLYYNSSFDRFLSLSIDTPIVRYIDLPEPSRPLAVKPPIRILAMISSPYNLVQLDVEQEWEKLKQALQPLHERGLVKLERLEKASLSALQRHLRRDEYHIFHYIGHGDFDAQTQDGVLLLEDEAKQGQRVSGHNLGMLLHDEHSLGLVLLNACEGARHSTTDPFAGSAQSLVRQGIPAVIAMQFEVTDQAAITLSQVFYETLAEGFPIDYALAEARKAIFAECNNVEWGTPVLYMRSPDGRIFDLEQPQKVEPAPVKQARIFLSYKREVIPDEPLALQLHKALSQKHDVFIDQEMPVGTPWAERIEAELKRSDFLVVLLSARSVNSEMVKAEIETAHRLSKEQNGRPQVLPVRLDYREPFPYPLNAYLDHINWAYWHKEADTAALVEELLEAMAGGALKLDSPAKLALLKARQTQPEREAEPLPFAQPVRAIKLEMPEGTMEPESKFYVEREGDRVALAAIARQGVTITIKAPRQMGKSSLLIRIKQEAEDQHKKRAVFLDFQLFDKATLSNADRFFRQFCAFLTDELGIEDHTEEFWQSPLGNSQRCTRYFERYLLKESSSPLLLAMDEVESIFDTDFRSDFFAMLRNWHNSRATKAIWKKLDLALVTSTEPYQLVENLNQSPFNVGEVIDLPDFTPEQVADLNTRHNSPLHTDHLTQLMTLLCGHPYLTRRALYLLASGRMKVAELFDKATDDKGP
ncbi:MAG: AAA-like domain-containing protein, partial [bacterium]